MLERYLEMKDGHRLFLRTWDDVKNPLATLHINHGMAEHSLRYDDFARYMNSLGIVPATAAGNGELNINVTNLSKASAYGNYEVEITVTKVGGARLFYDVQDLGDLGLGGYGLNPAGETGATKTLTFDYNGSQAASGDYTVTVTITSPDGEVWSETDVLALA